MKMPKRITKMMAVIFYVSILLVSCASSTTIRSNPSGAKIYLNGEAVGTTPYYHTDTKLSGASTILELKHEGYDEFSTTLSKNEEVNAGAVIGGIFFLIPFLWTMGYKPFHSYELESFNGVSKQVMEDVTNTQTYKAFKLRELKKLLDDEILTQTEYIKCK